MKEGRKPECSEKTPTMSLRKCHILLLLRFPAISVGFTILSDIFAYVTGFFGFFFFVFSIQPFIPSSWMGMLSVFLLPAFIRLGHECQDLVSPCDEMHVCTHKTSVYTHIRKSWGGGGERVESDPIKPMTLHQAGQRAQHTTNELFRPHAIY